MDFRLLLDDRRADRVMPKLRAFAHRLDLRRGVVFAHRRPWPATLRPGSVQLPQEAEALVRARTSSSVVELVLGDGGKDAALADAVAAADFGAVRQRIHPGFASATPATAGPKTSASRIAAISVSCRIRSKYQALSRASPYSTAPISLSPRSTSRLWTPREASRNTISSRRRRRP